MISTDSTLHKNQVRLTVSSTNSPQLGFLFFFRRTSFLRPQMDFMDLHMSQSTTIQIFKLQFAQTHSQRLKQSTDDQFDRKVNRQSKMKFFVNIHIFSKDSSFDQWLIIIHQEKIKSQQNPKFQN